MKPRRSGTLGLTLAMVGLPVSLVAHWMVLFWVPMEATQGAIQRIFYVHVPAAWLAELAFGLSAVCSVVYLWLRDERADAAALAAAEGGMFMAAVLLVVGPLWGKVAWGTYWSWEPRLTLTLLLFFIFIGYFMVRGSAAHAERGKRFAAVVAIVGAMDIPLIHMSVYWFRSLHPQPVVMRPDGPTADPRMLVTLIVCLGAYTLFFAGLLWLRYCAELEERQVDIRMARLGEVPA